MMIYIAHPYGGLEENKKEVEKIIEKLVEINSEHTYISPIHAFGFLYSKVDYDLGMDFCFDLLTMCDKVYFFGDIKSSKGCMMELELCKKLHMPHKIFTGKVKLDKETKPE